MATPFDVPSTLPYALPPFGDVRLEHYRPAFEAGMAEQRAEVEAIATDPHAPTVENTLIALERSGQLLTRVSHVFFTLSSADSTPELHDLEAEVSPLLAAHRDPTALVALYKHIAGTPAITLPMGESRDGLPLGLQFSTRPGGEAILLQLAFELERELQWPLRQPPVWVG